MRLSDLCYAVRQGGTAPHLGKAYQRIVQDLNLFTIPNDLEDLSSILIGILEGADLVEFF